MTWNNVRVRVTKASLPEDNEDRTQETRDGTMGWKMFRPSLGRTIWRSLCYGFLISFLSAFSIGAISIIIYYISYQVILVCLARHNQSVILIKIQWLKICERERITWGSYRTPRRERLATDIAIMSMLYEASAIISVNGFLHLHEYFYTYNKTCLQIIQSFVITTSVPLTIEWFFSGMSIAIETHYQNRPIFAVLRKQWKRHIIVAIINALPIAVWSSTSLLTAIQSQFKDMKDYCEMPFTHM